MTEQIAPNAYAVGIDVGGTNVKAVAVTPAGEVLDRLQHPTVDDAEALVASVKAIHDRLCKMRDQLPAWLGLSAPGLAARDGRSIAWMQGRMASVQGLDWRKALRQEVPVRVLNDAHAATVGETWLGAAAGCANVVLLTLGTGVGGGAIVDGRLLHGHLGRAGHVGHICLDLEGAPDICNAPGSLEDMVGDATMRQRSGGRFEHTDQLIDAVRAGDAEAQALWQRTVRALACGIASLINVLDPEVIVLGGGIAQAGDALFVPLREQLDQVEWRPTGEAVRLVPATLGPFAGAVGAARHAMLQPYESKVTA